MPGMLRDDSEGPSLAPRIKILVAMNVGLISSTHSGNMLELNKWGMLASIISETINR